jgi:hypothetical protein
VMLSASEHWATCIFRSAFRSVTQAVLHMDSNSVAAGTVPCEKDHTLGSHNTDTLKVAL